MTLTPAHGRDYKSAEEVRVAFERGDDFLNNPFDGPIELINKEDIETEGRPAYINIRYSQGRKVTVV